MNGVIDKADLPGNGTTFEGYHFGDVAVSFFLSDTAPGRGPRLHRHPYSEVFVVREGQLTFTVGGEEIVATAGQLVIAQPGTPHKFVNSGDGPARHIDIHCATRMETEWLEEAAPVR